MITSNDSNTETTLLRKHSRPKILTLQSVGFLAIILLSWIDELLGLPSLILQDHPYISDFHESTLEMLLVLGVWLLVASATRRVLAQVQQLEGMMRVCAWCHRVKHKGRWVPIEEFMQAGFDTPTSHDICGECLAREKAEVERARTARKPMAEKNGEGKEPQMDAEQRH